MMRRQVAIVFLTIASFIQLAWTQTATSDPKSWLTFSGNHAGWRYSQLEQINKANVRRVAPRWVFQTGDLGKFETTPWLRTE